LADEVLAEDHPARVNAHVEMALTHLALGRPAAAAPFLEPAVVALARRGETR
jgi:hypothetical protein